MNNPKFHIFDKIFSLILCISSLLILFLNKKLFPALFRPENIDDNYDTFLGFRTDLLLSLCLFLICNIVYWGLYLSSVDNSSKFLDHSVPWAFYLIPFFIFGVLFLILLNLNLDYHTIFIKNFHSLVWAPIYEEIIYRVLIIYSVKVLILILQKIFKTKLKDFFKRKVVQIIPFTFSVISGFLFSISHLDRDYDFGSLLYLGVFGFLYALNLFYSDVISVSILIHLNLNIIVLFLNAQRFYYIAFILWVLLWIYLLVIPLYPTIKRFINQKDKNEPNLQ